MEAYYGREENTTNNRMEMMAVLKCMELAAADKANNYICYSDSAYVVNMCNDWIRKWAQNGWQNSKKQTVENLDLVKKIYNYLNTNNNLAIILFIQYFQEKHNLLYKSKFI